VTALRSSHAPPTTRQEIDALARHCRKLVTRRALIAAGVAAVPVPGVDVAVDVGVLVSMIERINAAFALTPDQIDQLAPRRRARAYQAAMTLGGALVGRVVTRELVLRILKTMGVRWSARQAARWVPVAGQIAAASLGFAMLKTFGDRHVADCARVATALIDTG
jgi:uncharacterized protein (DUF697 family)